jgi:hypothetical protein
MTSWLGGIRVSFPKYATLGAQKWQAVKNGDGKAAKPRVEGLEKNQTMAGLDRF